MKVSTSNMYDFEGEVYITPWRASGKVPFPNGSRIKYHRPAEKCMYEHSRDCPTKIETTHKGYQAEFCKDNELLDDYGKTYDYFRDNLPVFTGKFIFGFEMVNVRSTSSPPTGRSF